MRRVAIYIRVSTREQAEKGWSVEGQYNDIRKYCESHEDWKVVRAFKDEGYSAKNLDRPGIQKILYHAQKGDIDIVVCWKYDRLSRDNIDFPVLLHFLDKYGVEIVSIGEPTPGFKSPYGEFVIGIMGLVATLERRNIQVRTKMGQATRLKKGLWPGGPSPYGYNYNKETGKLEIEPIQIEAVKEVYDKYQTWESVYKVREYMNKKGIPFTRGKTWTVRAVRQVLTNIIYTGIIKWGEVQIEDESLRIVDKETFDKLGEMVREEQKIGRLCRTYKVTYPRPSHADIDFDLKKNILPCPHCGRKLPVERCGHAKTKKDEKERYYCRDCKRMFTEESKPIPNCPICSDNTAMISTKASNRLSHYHCKRCLVRFSVDDGNKIKRMEWMEGFETDDDLNDHLDNPVEYTNTPKGKRIVSNMDRDETIVPCPECSRTDAVTRKGQKRYKNDGKVRKTFYCHRCNRFYDELTDPIPCCPNCNKKEGVQYKGRNQRKDGSDFKVYVCHDCRIKFKIPSSVENAINPVSSSTVATVGPDPS